MRKRVKTVSTRREGWCKMAKRGEGWKSFHSNQLPTYLNECSHNEKHEAEVDECTNLLRPKT